MPKKLSNEEAYEQAEREAIGEAIGETEQEIFDDALGRNPDENDGDQSLERMDDDLGEDDDATEAESDEDEVEAQGDEDEGEEGAERTEPEGREDRQDERQDRRGVPSARLRQESEARRAAEAEREAERSRVRELEARLALIERGGNRQQQEQPQTPQAPDMFADPEGWANHQRAQILQQVETQRVEGSLQTARAEHGERFDAAYQALARTRDPVAMQQIRTSFNPGRALLDWHDRQQLMSEIGNDPAAYRERVIREAMSDPQVRRQILTGMREDAERGDGEGQPRTRTRLPPSLSGASGGTSHRSRDAAPRGRNGIGTSRSEEQEIFASAFED